jgi:hypothetical protein
MLTCQCSSPNGRPRSTDVRTDSRSFLVIGRLTASTHRSGRPPGQALASPLTSGGPLRQLESTVATPQSAVLPQFTVYLLPK